MASFRQIHVKIWKDGWFLDLSADHKLLFIYLFSNERANLFGLYDLPLKVICFETGLPPDVVLDGLGQFADEGKAFHEDGWIWVRSLLTYNAQNLSSPKTQAHLKNTLDDIPDIPLKARALAYYRDKMGYIYPSDTHAIPILQEQEQEQDQTTGTEQEHHQQQEMDVAVDAVHVMEAHGMRNAETVLRETALSPAQLIDTVRYAEANGLKAGWVRTEARENRAHSLPDESARRRRFAQGEYVQS